MSDTAEVPEVSTPTVPRRTGRSWGRHYTAFGITKPLSAWAAQCRTYHSLLYSRYKKLLRGGDGPAVMEAVLRGVVLRLEVSRREPLRSEADRLYAYDGKTLTRREWEVELGLPADSLYGPVWCGGHIYPPLPVPEPTPAN